MAGEQYGYLMEEYLHAVNHFPNELQRSISSIRDSNVSLRDMLNNIGNLVESDSPDALDQIIDVLTDIEEITTDKQDALQGMRESIATKCCKLNHAKRVAEGLVVKKANQKAEDLRSSMFSASPEPPPNVPPSSPPQLPPPITPVHSDNSPPPIGESPFGPPPTLSPQLALPSKVSKRPRKPHTKVRRKLPVPAYEPPSLPLSSKPGPRITATVPLLPLRRPSTVPTTIESLARKFEIKLSAVSTKKKRARSNKKLEQAEAEDSTDETTYCWCKDISYGDMICCDNDKCDVQWFHFECVSLVNKPKGKWYCPSCRMDDRPNVMKSAIKSSLN